MQGPSPAAIPDDESARLATLASFELDEESERDLDDIVQLAAALCDTPIATVTFVDAERQWFKARVGLDIGGTAREIAFCAHTVLGDAPFVVRDAHEDPRFSSNPLVIGDPNLRFYAGFPLTTSTGSAIGTLAVMDRVPRELDPLQRRALQVLARQTVKWLELRRAEAALRRRVEQASIALDHATAEQHRHERLYRSLWETTTDAVLIVDADSRIEFASPSCRDLFGRDPTALVGQPLSLLQPERLRCAHAEGLARYLASGERRVDWRATETVALRHDGTEMDVEIAFSRLELDGKPHFVGFFRDIGERKQAERALHEEKERAQATLRAIGDGVVVLDELGRVTFMNPMAESLTGWSAQAALGLDHERVLSFVALDGATLLDPGDATAAPVPLSSRGLLLERRDGQTLSIEGSLTALRDRDGQRSGSVVAFRDVSRWRQLTALLSHQAAHDSLTGLVNRAELERRLQALTDAPAHGQVHSLLYLDLDQFKVVNDTSGHVAGDQMLKQLADLLRAQLRPQDTIARLGGDEFGVLLEHCSTAPALQVADKLRRAVADFSFPWGARAFSIGVSIGHVCFQSGEMSLAEVMGKADEACYLAKDLGRNRVHSHQPGDAELARRHGEMEWVLPLRSALKDGRFLLYAQRIFPLQSADDSPHYEILLRMRDEAGALVSPMAFLPAAERYDLMPAIDRWVIGSVIATLGARLAADPGQRGLYAVNVSGGSITDQALARFIREQLALHAVPGSCLCFEITETAAIANLSDALGLMRDLKDLGCRFSLDDFGTGMSSFAYLKRLPVDFLKIDGSFVRGIVADPVDRAMVTSIHQVAKLMGLRTIAEFVESGEIAEQLRLLGVDFGQGFGLEHPAPFSDAAESSFRRE